MNAIVLELAGDQIAITLRRKGEPLLARQIDLPRALELSGLLLRIGGLRQDIDLPIPGMTLRVAKGRSLHAWLSVSRDNAPDLIACIEGPAVREIGRRLHDLWLTAMGKSIDGPERSIYVRPVAHYLDEADEHSNT